MNHTGISNGPVRIPGPETEKKKLSLRNTNETLIPVTALPRMVYQDEVISSNNIITKKRAFIRTCLPFRNRKPHLRGSINLQLVAPTLNVQ
jgi:hypothetical protein